LFDALHSGKWAISGVGERTNSYEEKFGSAFAKYARRQFGVPCSSGTAALTIALQALGVGPGTAVVVPGLAWVACASAVLNLGAIPVLCDVDADSLCVDPTKLDEALNRIDNIGVLQMVHMYGSVCDIEAFQQKAKQYSVALLEDGSQAHGGRWRGAPIGSFGEISALSFQHSKLLTCGEGGICVTDDTEKDVLLQQYRADARIYSSRESTDHKLGYEIEVRGDVVGRNLCMSEFQAAIVLDALDSLDRETAHRAAMVDRFRVVLGSVPGARISSCPSPVDVRPYYRVAIRLDPEFVGRAPINLVARALARELNADVRPLDIPLDTNPLYQPHRHLMVRASSSLAQTLRHVSAPLPVAHDVYNSTVSIPHQIFLSSEDDMEDLASAFQKVSRVVEQNQDWHLDISSNELSGALVA
jgi:dTDP-4-amino-4,6-dideoxygalactose transaminase